MDYLNVSVATLLEQHPWAQDVLEWHGVDVDRLDPCLSVSALCWLEHLQPEVLTRDLLAAHPDRDGEDLLQSLAQATPMDVEPWEVPVELLEPANEPSGWWELAV